MLRTVFLAATAASLLAGAASAASMFTVTELQPLPGYVRGAVGSTSFGLANNGQSIGRSVGGPNGDRAVIWDRFGHPTELATPTGTWSSKADGINNLGVAVGDIGVGLAGDNNNKRAARWVAPGAYEFFLEETGRASFADLVTDNGWIAGLSYTSDYDDDLYRGFVWSPDGVTRLIDAATVGQAVEFFGAASGVDAFAGHQYLPEDRSISSAVIWTEAGGLQLLSGFGGFYTAAADVNDLGIATGTEFDGVETDQSMWWDADHNAHLLANLAGYTHGITTGINLGGQISGWSFVTECDGFADVTCRRATVWDTGGHVFNLNDRIDPGLGVTLLYANAINDRGQVQGEAMYADGRRFVFLATPVPEPATWAMLILGFGGVGTVLRRRAASHAAR